MSEICDAGWKNIFRVPAVYWLFYFIFTDGLVSCQPITVEILSNINKQTAAEVTLTVWLLVLLVVLDSSIDYPCDSHPPPKPTSL